MSNYVMPTKIIGLMYLSQKEPVKYNRMWFWAMLLRILIVWSKLFDGLDLYGFGRFWDRKEIANVRGSM